MFLIAFVRTALSRELHKCRGPILLQLEQAKGQHLVVLRTLEFIDTRLLHVYTI